MTAQAYVRITDTSAYGRRSAADFLDPRNGGESIAHRKLRTRTNTNADPIP